MSSQSRRVVITGVGFVTPLGSCKQGLMEAIAAGKSGVQQLESIPQGVYPTSFGGEARHFSGKIDDFGELEKDQKRAIRKGIKVMCREIQMGVAAAQMSLADAGWSMSDIDSERTGVVYGSDYIMTTPDEFVEGIRGCFDENQAFQYDRWAADGIPKVTPLWLLKYLPNMPASHIAIYNDLRGPNNSITLREASANLAIGEAYATILRGSADVMLAGATGTRVHPTRTIHVALQEQLAGDGTTAEAASRPFDRSRSGMVIGEGAGAVVMEELEVARARGATILGEVVGQGSSTVMSQTGEAHIDQAVRNVLSQVLRSSQMQPEDVGHIHAHGLSTQHSDADEAQGIHAVFGQRTTPVPVTAAKSYFGNLGAGGGVVELVTSLLAMQEGRLFPILNYETPDEACPIHASQGADVATGDSFINISISPQGQASAIAVRKCA